MKFKLMKRLIIVFIIAFFWACEKQIQPNLTVTGKVIGLKKGTLYLERVQDTSLVILDSMIINGQPDFVLQTFIDEPEVLHLSLNSNSKDIPRVTFFADSGTTTIHTTLKRFLHDAKIEGSPQQDLLNSYNEMIAQFNDKNLELIKAQFENANDSIKLDSIGRVTDNLLKSKYRYTFNFAMTNKDSEVAPYLALSEVYDANITYLDTLYNVLPQNIAQSRYGKQLQEYIAAIKNDTINP